MLSVETNTRKIVARLKREGWLDAGGAKHDLFENEDFPGTLVVVPRHKEQSLGVARSIAKQAGWL